MQESHDVKTKPGEPHAVPEYAPHAVLRPEGQAVQMDDINIPMVATAVAFFAIFLTVVIISLQAWFHHQQAAEMRSKTPAQDDPRTELGALLQRHRRELYDPPSRARVDALGGAVPAGATQQGPRNRIPIDRAMVIVARDYAGGANRQEVIP